jgi:hypothetical protein
VPVRDAHGASVGHRLLRAAQLDLTWIDARGRVVAHTTEPAAAADASARRASSARLLAALGIAD